jgi:hypothetical protein
MGRHDTRGAASIQDYHNRQGQQAVSFRSNPPEMVQLADLYADLTFVSRLSLGRLTAEAESLG